MEKALKDKLEKEGEKKAAEIVSKIENLAGCCVNTDISNNPFLNIIKEGNEEFNLHSGLGCPQGIPTRMGSTLFCA
jgi:hypothetical protein